MEWSTNIVLHGFVIPRILQPNSRARVHTCTVNVDFPNTQSFGSGFSIPFSLLLFLFFPKLARPHSALADFDDFCEHDGLRCMYPKANHFGALLSAKPA